VTLYSPGLLADFETALVSVRAGHRLFTLRNAHGNGPLAEWWWDRPTVESARLLMHGFVQREGR